MINVLMTPHMRHFRSEESGIKRVVEAYFKYLPQFGVNLVQPGEPYDIKAVHAGGAPDADVAHVHGLYWTADYNAAAWEWRVNASVIESVRHARQVTVPSEWVAESFKRDMRFSPHVIGHGIDWDDWADHNEPQGDYVLWNKNRMGDVCDPRPVIELARRFHKGHFVSTFAPDAPGNVSETGVIPHAEMKKLIQSSAIYLATTKETFGIGILEAMAAGKPILGYAHGCIVDLVRHGVNGYLAKPGDIDDLAEGLRYCIEYVDVLGRNGRAMAKEYTWERVCEQVAEVYRLAMQTKAPTVAVVIPAFMYADTVGRAIESASRQTYKQLTDIVVVDDGSPDDGATEREVKAWAERDERVKYVRQDNAGVANARNRGITEVDTKYICCLDADDQIHPDFVATCVPELEQDNSLGIAYTGLYYRTPDGGEGLSPWPGEFNFDKHLTGANQIPTCNLFRRDMWARLGGYRQRYAPGGAGEEDAEFWMRCAANGWGAQKVTDEGLFWYAWQSGRVSGNKEHAVTDWRGLAPYVKDGKHPFASRATPKRFSHPVRQYDEPVVSVVIPVGPGHEKVLIDALDSLESQTFRQWEAIVVFDTGNDDHSDTLTAYPYIRPMYTDGKGAGYARNKGAGIARGKFLLFLDADDMLYPLAIEKMVDRWDDTGAAVYTDYVGKAYVDSIEQLDKKLQERIYRYDERTGEAIIGYRAKDYTCEVAQRQPEGKRPYIWCNITTLIPRAWHVEIGGFDESMESWEDVDYWYRMAHRGKCFSRIEEELLVYRFYTGTRRDRGVGDFEKLIAYLKKKYEGVEMGGCGNCGNRRSITPTAQRAGAVPSASRVPRDRATGGVMTDEDFVLCRYDSPNRGNHMVVGGAGFRAPIPGLNMLPRGGAWYIKYGYHSGGRRFKVHNEDIRLAPHLFKPIKEAAEVPEIREEIGVPSLVGWEDEEIERPGQITASQAPRAVTRAPVDVEPITERDRFDLQRLPGISADIAQQLRDDGIETVDDVRQLGAERLQQYRGIGKKRSEMIIGSIRALNV